MVPWGLARVRIDGIPDRNSIGIRLGPLNAASGTKMTESRPGCDKRIAVSARSPTQLSEPGGVHYFELQGPIWAAIAEPEPGCHTEASYSSRAMPIRCAGSFTAGLRACLIWK